MEINKFKKINGSWRFLIVVLLIYFVVFFINHEMFMESLLSFFHILYEIVPVLSLVFLFMFAIDYFVKPDFVLRNIKGKGVKQWLFVIIGGILSSGPIYMWYPFLADLVAKGLNHGLVACFLYNRAIKIPLLPLAAKYFGWEYVIWLFVVMTLASIFQGILINKLIKD